MQKASVFFLNITQNGSFPLLFYYRPKNTWRKRRAVKEQNLLDKHPSMESWNPPNNSRLKHKKRTARKESTSSKPEKSSQTEKITLVVCLGKSRNDPNP
jgi:hypothetical protein